MDDAELAALRAIDTMRERMGEQLTVDDLARAAMFSKFHFTRMFQRTTGVSPGRFLSALRLQRAKDLLVTTSMNVADISIHVGFNSVGTFSSRFSRSVGMSPTTYRRRAGFAAAIDVDSDVPAGRGSHGSVTCTLRAGHATDALTFAGLFADPIPQGKPVSCAVLDRPGRLRFGAVPAGSWYLLAQSLPAMDADTGQPDRADRPVSVASHGPIVVRPDSQLSVEVTLRRFRALDPPVLLALLDARKYAIQQLNARNALPAGSIAQAA
ncbi:MAG: helix-turn-helix transcriptional regulator [Actinomycetota bacterium]|nr:helix-turn-helix transcriptional regulator [Actinomycetota bacterium]